MKKKLREKLKDNDKVSYLTFTEFVRVGSGSLRLELEVYLLEESFWLAQSFFL